MATDYKLIGVPCGQHGPYTFYKAFKYSKNGKANILALSEFFFVKMWSDNDLISIGELQLLWEDKNTEQTLASLRLYILPENTPDGRQDFHGEDEVLAITEKVVLRVEDLLTCLADASDWSWGLTAVDCGGKRRLDCVQRPQLLNDCTAIEMHDIDKEKELLDALHWETSVGVVVLSFPRYCRYRGLLKRLEGVHNEWLRTALVVALGGFTVPCRNTRVLFCKDTFDYPDLEGHELLCNHLAPKLKGRPRKKRKIYSNTPEGSECESESSQSTTSSTKTKVSYPLEKSRNGLSPRRSTRGTGSIQEKQFLDKLFAFMKNKNNPITRIPSIGFKEIDLYSFYHKVQNLGGYHAVTAGRMWKYVYEELGGDQNSTSAATISRRHYERLLLPYERQHGGNHASSRGMKKQSGESSSASTSASSSSVSIMTSLNLSSSVSITPSVTITPNLPNKIVASTSEKANDKRSSNKMLSLRGIRLKPEKMLVDAGGGKENIPLSITSKPDLSSELIDLCSEDSQSPNKGNVSVQPTLKKQKLEILKEGGLEVTPVTSSAGVSSTSTSGDGHKSDEGRPSVIRHPAPEPSAPDNKLSIRVPEMSNRACLNIPEISRSKMVDSKSKTASGRSKISIMVTPDLSTMLRPPSAHTSNGQQRLYPSPPASPWSKRTIYGNPKDIIQPPTIKRPVAEEVLDLRMKGGSGGESETRNNASALPPSRQIGSNLEITLVPTKASGLPPPPTARRNKSSPAPSNGHVESIKPTAHAPSLIIPNLTTTTNSRRKSTKKTNNSTAAAAAHGGFPLQFAAAQMSPAAATALDSFYLSALFNNLLPTAAAASPAAAFGPAAHQLQLYKELYCRQMAAAAAADPLPENFPRLLQDGSTSITLVNSTPTSK